jgi:Ca-activated chloride channel family protein
MSIPRLLRSPRARRGIAAGAIVLALGGLVLVRAPATADARCRGAECDVAFVNGVRFAGPGATGSLALSHGAVLADGRERVYAQLLMRADDDGAVERAPISLVMMLDTSGSMSGAKLEQAKQNAIRMLEAMHGDDEVAFVRYDSGAELVQGMARVSTVRDELRRRIGGMEAGGGTNIPAALRLGMQAAESADRVRRLVLVSDGIDATRQEAERLARDAVDRGITVSALGIGLDFDESYLAGVAGAGRGNFAFVEDASALGRFLARELRETAATTVERATARIQLPRGLRFVRAVGAEVHGVSGGEVELRLGALFAGDERRVVLELEADAPLGDALHVDADVSWLPKGAGEMTRVALDELRVVTTTDPAEVSRGRDGRVFASCTSAIASLRQLEAAEAYNRGDQRRAHELIEENVRALRGAATAAPPEDRERLEAQAETYTDTQGVFSHMPPGSAEGRAAAKRSAAQDVSNLDRKTF